MTLIKIDYMDDSLWRDEFKCDLEPQGDIELTGTGAWTETQIEVYKDNRRKKNDVNVIAFIRKSRQDEAEAIEAAKIKEEEAQVLRAKELRAMKMQFLLAIIGVVGAGVGGYIWLFIAG